MAMEDRETVEAAPAPRISNPGTITLIQEALDKYFEAGREEGRLSAFQEARRKAQDLAMEKFLERKDGEAEGLRDFADVMDGFVRSCNVGNTRHRAELARKAIGA